MPEPIEPTRVYPSAESGPDAPVEPPTAPWWTTAPPPGPIVVRVEHHVIEPPAPPPATPRWQWSALWASLASGLNLVAAAAALAPVFAGQSLGTLWGHALYLCRTQQAISGAYVMAGTTTLCAWLYDRRRRPSLLGRTALIVCLFGTAAMASPYDPVTFLTGVHP